MILGLTGGIASGKSTVSTILKNKGAKILDADIIARKVVKLKSKGLGLIVQEFGKDILKKDGSLNRKLLGNIVFSDKKQLAKLEKITAPLIRHEIEEQINKNQKEFIVLDIPLLFEGDYAKYCDYIMVVYVPLKTQLKRLMFRDNLTEKNALKRIESQMDSKLRNQLADVIIDNSKTVEDTRNQVLKWFEKVCV